MDLTGMEIAIASLLDEASAAAEAMIMFYNSRKRKEILAGKNKFFVADNLFPQTIEVVKGRAKNLDIELIIGDYKSIELDEHFFGSIIPYTDVTGSLIDIESFISESHHVNSAVAVSADILSLVLLKSPGSMGADVVFGTTQRFGVPMGYGGPHAAYFAAKESFKRNMPGRIIGISIDADENQALRMALQTREQHIKRDKATSNICTAQALLAVIASMYAVYHGPKGLKEIANNVHSLAKKMASDLMELNVSVGSHRFFDTVHVKNIDAFKIKSICEENSCNINCLNENEISNSFAATHNTSDVD